MRILVTGARGFVGLNVTLHLASAGHDVIAADRTPVDRWVQEFLREQDDRIAHIEADLNINGDLARAVPEGPLDAVVHAAIITATTIGVELEHARSIVDTNVGGTIEALEVACERGARRMVYVSSPSAFGEVEATTLIAEQVVPHPESLYGITKLASEMIVKRWETLQPIDTVSVRIAQPYGPGERATTARVRTSPIWEWLQEVDCGGKLPTGPLERSRDWTYVEETARGIAELATSQHLAYDLYHLGTGEEVFVSEVVEELARRFGRVEVDEHPPLDVLNPNIAGPGRPALDPTRFEREFGWKPEVSIRDGMTKYLLWWTNFRARVGVGPNA